MEKTQQAIQTLQTSSSGAVIGPPSSLAALRMDEANHPHYGKIPTVPRRKWLTSQLTKLIMLKHQRPDPDMLQLDVVALDEYIMEDEFARDLTLDEIDYAFRHGLKGDYGEYYGLTADSLFGFLKGFMNTPEKLEAARIIREAREKKKRSEGAVDYVRKVAEHKAQVWAERMKEWQKEKDDEKDKH